MTTPNTTSNGQQRPRRAAHFSAPENAQGDRTQSKARPARSGHAGPAAARPAAASAAPGSARTAGSGVSQRAAAATAAASRRKPGSGSRVGAGSALSTGRVSGAAARATKRAGSHDVRREQTKRRGGSGMIVGGVIAAVILILAVVFVVVPSFSGRSSDTQDIVAGQTVTVTIPDGSGASAVAQALFDAKVIANKSDFLTQVSRMNAGSDLKSGEYTITTGGDMSSLVELLCSGSNSSGLSLTIPEGYTVARIAAAVESKYGISADEFIAQAKASNYVADYSFLEGASGDSLEGFLFPKTYSFPDGATADGIIRAMLTQFQTELATLDLSYPESQGLSVADMVNLASIVEKESTQSTAAQVAAVFYNRLGNFGDPNYGYLQSDATTAYTVGHDPTAEEVHDESDPYSTYAHQGLPPTPICCPGLDALQAVCSPDQTALDEGDFYFYFWNDADGNVQYKFSKTYEEHQRAIADASN